MSLACIGAKGAFAANNPFDEGPRNSSYLLLADAHGGKCGGKSEQSIHTLEGKCGSGKCGTARIRGMMDSNGDGRIDRSEYNTWSLKQSNEEFDRMAAGAESVSVEKAFQTFQDWESVEEHLR
jgi:uncharacterized low-complexity protein